MVGTHPPAEVVPGWPEPPDDSVVGTPARQVGSVRRTASINMIWPDGFGTPLELRGRARDLLTPAQGEPVILAEAGMVVRIGEARTVTAIEAWPAAASLERLVGARGGSAFRSAIDDALPGERQAATPLYFLLDDIAGASLIAGFAWSRSRPEWGQPRSAAAMPARIEPIGMRKGRLICSGLRPNGYHQLAREQGNPSPHFVRLAGNLASPDPWAWHEIEAPADVCLRRRRRVDVWPRGEVLHVDAHFRDSFWDVDGTELALHEYTLGATVDRSTRRILTLEATPRVLPFPECPGAAPHAKQLVGMPVDAFRTSVQETLRELEACTHLNDMLRCLGEVHALADLVETASDPREQMLEDARADEHSGECAMAHEKGAEWG